MNALLKMIAVAGVVAAPAAPAFAEAHMVDPMTLTCAEFTAMDADGMKMATRTVDTSMAMTEEQRTAHMAMTDEEKTAAMADAEAMMSAMTEEETATADAVTETLMAAMVAGCATMPDGTVIDAMGAM